MKKSDKSACKITVACTTWSRETYGLFDYESKSVTTAELTLPAWCRLIRNKEFVELRPLAALGPADLGTRALASISSARGRYWVFDPFMGPGAISDGDDTQEKLWLTLRDYVNEEGGSALRLSAGDIIKLGRCKFLIKEIVSKPNNIARRPTSDHLPTQEDCMRFSEDESGAEMNLSEDENVPPNNERCEPAGPDHENRCRVCLSDTDTKDNPLVASPCKCSGSVKYLHLLCLQYWLKNKVTVTHTAAVASYSWQPLQCDVCKEHYPGTPNQPNNRGDPRAGREAARNRAHPEARAQLHAHAESRRGSWHAQLYVLAYGA